MKKIEFESKLGKLGLKKVFSEGMLQNYKEHREFYKYSQTGVFFGCYSKKGEIVVFFKDSERGVEKMIGQFDSEDEAYENLYNAIKKWDESYNK